MFKAMPATNTRRQAVQTKPMSAEAGSKRRIQNVAQKVRLKNVVLKPKPI